ncbi:SPW repeat-containing protein [Bradyrhizobium brasilense]|uniref:SPW repeat-containing protein n=1 Tax=Bradyrhizobium brasilense TaxID=1419277 RepID=A0A1G7HL78_9BRAD|nr:SPW repeat protein [Bradyrhizobium brasilense]SDF01257.1 SPW repeat-containing protein [Bradyrhizobium brasilense]
MNTDWKKDMIADAVNLVIGLGLFASPWAFGFAAESPANWNAWLSGILIAALAVAALAIFAEWQEWMALAAGVWVALSPWVLHFSGTRAVASLHVIAGLLVAAVAAWRLWYLHQSYPRVTA